MSALVTAFPASDRDLAIVGRPAARRIANDRWMMMQAMLLRLAYLGATNALALLRLLPMIDHDKDAEILILRHQVTVLERQLHGERPQSTQADRALLAALPHRLPRDVLHSIRLLVHPDTVLRWHRDLLAARHAKISRPKRPGRPPTVRSIRALVLRLARENESWGYHRIQGELLTLDIKVAASTVWQMLRRLRTSWVETSPFSIWETRAVATSMRPRPTARGRLVPC